MGYFHLSKRDAQMLGHVKPGIMAHRQANRILWQAAAAHSYGYLADVAYACQNPVCIDSNIVIFGF